ncbi:MAG: ATP-binding protein [Rhodoferax sp.]
MTNAPLSGSSAPPLPSTGSPRFAMWLWGVVLLVDVLLVALLVFITAQNRLRAEEAAERQVTNYARILEESVLGLVGRIDMALQTSVDEIGPQTATRLAPAALVQPVLARQTRRLPESLGLRLVDAQGDIRFVGDTAAAPPYVSVADRDWFARIRADGQTGLLISKPVMGGVVHESIVTMARRLQTTDGHYAGHVQVAVAMRTLIEMFSRLDLGAKGNVGLWDRETLYGRYTRADAQGRSVGATTPSPALHALLQSGQREAIYRGASGIDGIERVYAFRRVGSTPLSLVVGLADDEYLAAWRSDALRTAALGAVFLIATLVLATLIHRSWRANQVVTASWRERSEEAEAAKRQVELVLSSVGDGVCGVDLEGRIIFANQAACRMFGWAEGEGLGQNLHQLTHHHRADGSVYPPSQCPVAQTMRDGQWRHTTEETCWRKDGSSFPTEFTAAPIVVDGKVIGAVNVFQDISERKRTEAELVAAKLAAEAASLAKSDFLANMSHEIRTPLNGVLGMAQIGFRDSAQRVKTQQTFGRILASGRILMTIINDILDFSKIEAGKLALEDLPLDPGRLVDDTLQAVTVLSATKSILLVADKQSLPPAVLGDPVRLSQILYNLLSNAIKFTDSGEVRLGARTDGQDLVFTVRDTGIGIPEDVAARLFQPFEQADTSTTRRFGGTGLGLAICRRLAALMGGALSLQSTPGAGSTFTLRLPLRPASLPAPQAAAPAVAGTRRLAGLHLLVAEDNAVNQMVLEDLLRGEGADVVLADNGQMAVDLVQRTDRPFDAVLMDVQMPVMDGLGATRVLQQTRPGLPVIGQTAHALREEIDKCLAAGMVRTISKPIDLEVLVATLLQQIPVAAPRPPAGGSSTGQALPPPSPVPQDLEPVIDWAGFTQRFAGRSGFVDRLVHLFLEHHAADGAQLRALADAGDVEGIEHRAHDLKSSAGNVFAVRVQKLAMRAMEHARRREPGVLDEARTLAAAMDEALQALRTGRPG